MGPRSALALVAFSALLFPSPGASQTRLVDQGTFVVLKDGSPVLTESFRISRGDAGVITATASHMADGEQTATSLTTDSLGTPLRYELRVRKQGASVMDLIAIAGAGRLRSRASAAGGNELMKEYLLVPGRSVILDHGVLHQLYFLPLGNRSGSVQVIEPLASRTSKATLAARGLEPIQIAGRSVTATHYSLSGPAGQYEFWADAQGRLLRVDVPAEGLSATREELPR